MYIFGLHCLYITISKPNSLLGRVFIGKYGKGNLENIFQTKANQYWRWGGLLKTIDIVVNHLWWQVGNGEYISINSKFWWTPSYSLPYNNCRVKDLISCPNARWNVSVVGNYYDHNLSSCFCKIPISKLGTQTN